MPSKMSLFNKELMLQMGRSTGWISVIYLLGLLFVLPIRILLILYSDSDNFLYYQSRNNLFQYDYEIQVFLIAIAPVILAVFLFRFLHVKQAADLMHSLPLKRSRIFHHYALTGMVLLILPVAIVTGIVYIMHFTYDLGSLFTIHDLLYWSGTVIVITLLLYIASVFVGIMTGISVVQAVLAYVFLFFPIGITVLLSYNLKILLYGFPGDFFLNRQLEKLSPITFVTVLESRAFQWKDAVLYIVMTLVLYGLSLFFYKKRNLESASEAIAFPKLRSVFKYGTAFCFMLLGGSYFNDVSFKNLGWTLFGYGIGAGIGYFAAEMVLLKTWRVFTRIKGLVVYLAVIAFLVVGVQALGFYENRIPKQNDIKNVLLTDNPNFYMRYDGFYGDVFDPKPMKEPENIDAVLKLHKQILANKKVNQQENNKADRDFFIVYELKNGQKEVRQYRVMTRLYEDFYKPIYESKEFKMTSKEIYMMSEKKVKYLQIRANGPLNKVVTLSTPEDVRQALSLLKEDVLAETYDDHMYYTNGGAFIQFNVGKEQSVVLDYMPTYVKFTNWLKEKEMLEQARLTAADISHVVVAKGDFSEINDSDLGLESAIEKSKNALKITDKGQIEQVLEKAGSNPRHEYAAVVYYNGGNFKEIMFFDEEHVPEFIKNHFK
ncbi:multidrug ABC transporter permease [Neobacillus sp. 114]|uniref:multidrug ABC transporter permease n=1 Tax=Neobacillus sp. 114 TaxID=3048535 RepID=UPI0024C41FDA|nr:multidrug ABC transporter permease [Neobacillus sp. 114]